MKKVALIGNPNCGKTTCFNVLTHSSLRVGNFPGTTVSPTQKSWVKDSDVIIIDLPGIYSLTPYTPEETITTNYLLHESVDFILNIVDTTTCMRGLFLSLQCMELHKPMVILFNFFDQSLDLHQLSLSLDLPCFSIQSITQKNLFECIETLLKTKKVNLSFPFYQQDVQKYFEYIQHLLKHASFLIVSKKPSLLDRWLLSKTGGYLFLLFFFFLIFILSFGILGPFFSKVLTHFFDYFLQQLYFVQSFIHPLLFSLITNGILKGCLSVLQFLPLILVLFFFLSCLEESGYLSRVAVLMDQPLKRIGCTGKSFVPLLLGLGCSVPAILATRILKNSNERKHIIFLLPFLSCSAKIPVYSFFAFLFFPNYALFILFLLYFSGLFLGSFLLSLLPKENNSFILELPPYRFPSIKNTFRLIKEKTKEFMNKVFSLLLILHVFLWFIQSFTFHFTYTTNPTVSMLYVLAQSISWIFQPLGFNDWRITTALITGFTAKEAILSTLSILFQSSDITQFLSPSSAFSLLLFILLYSPCIATISITMKEAGIKTALFMILFQCLIAWIVAFVFFQLTQFF